MKYTIESDSASVTIDGLGCTLSSLLDKKTGSELLWQKDPAAWNCQDILIFPVIDRPTFGINGKSYCCDTKHGFVRTREFTPILAESNRLILETSSDEETKRQFPFDFNLRADFSVDGNTLSATYTITNKSDREMPFYFGIHPALKAENGEGILSFGQDCRPIVHYLKDKEVFKEERGETIKEIAVNKAVLNKYQTIILSDVPSSYTLTTKSANFHFSCESPVLSLWSNPVGDYICVEPWWGMAVGKTMPFELADRQFVNKTRTASEFSYRLTINKI